MEMSVKTNKKKELTKAQRKISNSCRYKKDRKG